MSIPTYLILAANDISAAELSAELFSTKAGFGKVSFDTLTYVHEADTCVRHIVGDPLDELENFPKLASQYNLELARIIALVDASMLEKRHGQLREWFSALTHFADVLLLTNTKDVSPQWFSTLQKSLKDRPMELYLWPQALKKSPDATLAAITTPQARRLSQYFDVVDDVDVPIFTGEGDDEVEVEEDDLDAQEAADEEIPEEKFFARDAAGRRAIKIIAP